MYVVVLTVLPVAKTDAEVDGSGVTCVGMTCAGVCCAGLSGTGGAGVPAGGGFIPGWTLLTTSSNGSDDIDGEDSAAAIPNVNSSFS